MPAERAIMFYVEFEFAISVSPSLLVRFITKFGKCVGSSQLFIAIFFFFFWFWANAAKLPQMPLCLCTHGRSSYACLLAVVNKIAYVFFDIKSFI